MKRLLETLSQWEQRKSRTCKELESLIGSLQHACTVIQPARTFMRSAIPLLKVAKCQHHHIRLSTDLRSDLAWWRIFARHWNGTALVIPHNAKQFEFTSDASGSWGALSKRRKEKLINCEATQSGRSRHRRRKLQQITEQNPTCT